MKRVVLRVEELLGVAAARHRPHWMVREDCPVLASASSTHVTRVVGQRTSELGPNWSDRANADRAGSCFDYQGRSQQVTSARERARTAEFLTRVPCQLVQLHPIAPATAGLRQRATALMVEEETERCNNAHMAGRRIDQPIKFLSRM